ncbi:ATP-binding protein [Spongiactinospora sp. TRM90649]|uniref:AAA family ATPase n=1 Tax=Spongiactinospora sp. TRM90649 TaxID=3031114 RepID=UPI0023F7C455|nr:ATP-binding protein [Spongiactinospora sp. TRM90649]MDF5756886.1 ATP-binding protein [Spongiactinospora sp. TRM90649]
MLLSFRTANHRSLRQEQQLLLTSPYGEQDARDPEWQAVTVAAVFGPNASGKSNVLDAIRYMAYVVRWSFRENEPGAGLRRNPFALDINEPSVYVVDLSIDDVRYTYGFAVDDDAVVEEWLYSYPRKRERKIFERGPEGFTYGTTTPDSIKALEELVEPNVLLLSVGGRARQQMLQPVYSWFAAQRFRSPVNVGKGVLGSRLGDLYELQRSLGIAELQDRIASLMRAADTGIADFEITEETDEEFAVRVAQRQRLGADRTPPRDTKLLFRHKCGSGEFALTLRDESEGTRQMFYLAMSVLPVLQSGSVLLADELDASLHTYLSARLIHLFQDPATNPRGAQLIFASHDSALLGRVQGRNVLDRDQIWFTEKGEDGGTQLFPLTDFKPRKEDNRERRYLTGRYGAVPDLDDELFAAALATRVEFKHVSPAS